MCTPDRAPTSGTVGRLHDGDRVDVSRCTSGYSWCEISHRGTDGWVAARYLSRPPLRQAQAIESLRFSAGHPRPRLQVRRGSEGPRAVAAPSPDGPRSRRARMMVAPIAVPIVTAATAIPAAATTGGGSLLYGRQLPRRQLLCACRRERPQAWSPLERSHLVDPRHRRCARARLRGLQLSWPLPCRDARPAEARPARQRRDLVLSGDVILLAARRDERRRRRYIRSCGGCRRRRSGRRRPCRRSRRW